MKVIVAGSRGVTDIRVVETAVARSGFQIKELVSGTCHGVDTFGELIAIEKDIPVKRFPAEWNKYGRSAGPRRNKVMADYADALIAVWDNKSRGTSNMIDEACIRGMKVYVYDFTTGDGVFVENNKHGG